MGTKNNPGKFDCHASAEDDEPLFTLLARDPLAPYLVAAWAEMRMGNPAKVREIVGNMLRIETARYYLEPDTAKAIEALTCANMMPAWRQKHRPDGAKTVAETYTDARQRVTGKHPALGMPYGRAHRGPCCGTPACPQCSDTIALEPGFIHEGP